ncbi:MAG: hypothetical protein P4L51_17650 [Puia sp.]|nr:hypothetical protein [Puia sp.]
MILKKSAALHLPLTLSLTLSLVSASLFCSLSALASPLPSAKLLIPAPPSSRSLPTHSLLTTDYSLNHYAIGMFHFNLQYVAGDYKIERRIIEESLFPVLQFFDKNPQYKSDIEIQGYAIDLLAEEHPAVLALLKKLVKRKQIELVIAHYSDQFFIGYPALDMQRSIELSDQALARQGLERSRVFFGQEIQWSPGMAYALKGKYDVVVTSSDPNSWYNDETLPLVNVKYGDDSIEALIGGGKKKLNGMDWTIAFLDDGEEFNSLDYNSNFYRVPEQEKLNVDNYKKLLDQGYQFVTITELTQKIKKDPGYTIPDYPFTPEGTWHMNVCGPFMWMGRQRSGVETDGVTRALSYQARGEVMMAENLVAYAEKQGKDVEEVRKLLKEAWKHLLLSEVSDSSGWDPWLVEVQYTDNEVATTRMLLKKILEQLRKMLAVSGKSLLVNTGTGSVEERGAHDSPLPVAASLPVNFAVNAQSYNVRISKLSEVLYRMDVQCTRPDNGAVEIVFDTAPDGLQYSASCGEQTKVTIPTTYKHDPAFALTNGFIYLNNGYSLVKDCTVEHLAATWKMKSGKLVFREELKEGNMTMNMRFYVLKGSADQGLQFANSLNAWPSYCVKFREDKIEMERITP